MYNFFKLIDVSLYIILNEYRIYRYYFPKEILVLYNCTTVLAIYNSLPWLGTPSKIKQNKIINYALF